MLVGSFELHEKYKNNSNVVLPNAALECFLIHARNLIDFFENNRKGVDDLTCINFVDRMGKPINKSNIQLSSEIKTEINKNLAHMTARRHDSKVFWKTGTILNELVKQARIFLAECDDSSFPESAKKYRILWIT